MWEEKAMAMFTTTLTREQLAAVMVQTASCQENFGVEDLSIPSIQSDH